MKSKLAAHLVGMSLVSFASTSAQIALAQGAPPNPWLDEPPADPAQAPSPLGPAPAASPPAGAPPGAPAPPPGDGAYVVVPPSPPVPPPEPIVEDSLTNDGELVMGAFMLRPFVTHIGQSPRPDDPSSIVGAHVGFRAHGLGLDDDLIGRGDLEGFLGASSEGFEGEGRAFLAVGLAYAFESRQHLMFRFGAGGALLGNPVVDYQVAELPALELGYVRTGPVVFEVAPRVAMGVLHMAAFDTGSIAPDPAPAAGGRIFAGDGHLWGMFDYEAIATEKPFHIGALTACYADKLALCIDGRLASGSLDLPRGGSDRVTAISGGLSIGTGAVTNKDGD